MTMCVEPSILSKLRDKNVKSLDELDGSDVCWFIVRSATPKQTKNGKAYLLLEALSPSGKTYRVFCWGWDGKHQLQPYSLCVAEVSKTDFGMSTKFWKLKEVEQ
jgi:hypothetical protein